MFDLKGRTAFISGGAGILGRQHAEALAEMGADIILGDILIENAWEIAEEISRAFGVKCRAVFADISDMASVSA